jgi:hypothetical protein
MVKATLVSWSSCPSLRRRAPARFSDSRKAVEDAVEDEHFLFADAEEIVVVGAALDDVAGGLVEATGAIDRARADCRAGADGAFAGLHGRGDDGGAAGDADQADLGRLAECVERFDGRLLDAGDQILDTDRGEDGLVVGADGEGGGAGAAGVGIEDDGVAGRHDVDDVAGEGGDRVGDRQDGRDDAVGRVLFEGDAVIAAARVGVQPFDAGHEFHDLELFDLVGEAADLRLVELEFAPRLGVAGDERLDDLHDLGATLDAFDAQLLEGRLGGGAGAGRIGENAEPAAGRRGHDRGSRSPCGRAAVAGVAGAVRPKARTTSSTTERTRASSILRGADMGVKG